MTDTTNRDLMIHWLMANGFKDNGNQPLSAAQASAIAGNIQAESGFGFNVTEGHVMDGASNDAVDAWTKGKPRGLGLVQWTWNPGRAGNLIALARSLKLNWYDPEVQFQMIRNEIDGGYGKRLAAAGFFLQEKSPGELAIIFHDIYEGSADTASMKQRRAVYAEEAYSTLTEGGSLMANLVNHPGMSLRDDAAASLARFERDHGKQPITSAQRSVASQQALIDRWNRGGAANRPPYLYQPAPISGKGASRHLSGIALDTSNPAVFHSFGAAYGWRFLFAYDKVHFEYDPAYDTKKGSGSTGSSTGGGLKFSQVVKDRQTWMIKNGYNLGKGGADGLAGNDYKAAVKSYQTFLKAHWGYKGDLDGIWGTTGSGSTQAAHQRFYDSKKKPAPAPSKPAATKAPAYPLKSNEYFGPKSGPVNSISGYFSHAEDLKKWQTQMKKRGWSIAPTGRYDDATKRVTLAFQAEKKITKDGKIGGTTWRLAWEAPIT